MTLDERAERAIKAAISGPPLPPEVIDVLRDALPPTRDEYIAEIVAAAPPLSPVQRAQTQALLGQESPKSAASYVMPRRQPAPSPKVALYRHYDADGALLYIGISNDIVARGRHHAKWAQWMDFAVRVEAEWFETRQRAEDAERAAIQAERPLFNGMYSTPDAKRACVEYLVKADRLDLLKYQGAS